MISAKNPNVMFELGLRLSFDKPTIIVKDDKTSYSFDTSPIEHLTYPRDLRFSQIVDFKSQLSSKIKSTHRVATNDPNYTTFLKHFGTFAIAKLDSKEVSADELILIELRDLRVSLSTRSSWGSSESLLGGKLADDKATIAMERTSSEIKRELKERQLTSKDDIRAAREEVKAALERRVGPEYFPGPREYAAFFDSVFTLMYG